MSLQHMARICSQAVCHGKDMQLGTVSAMQQQDIDIYQQTPPTAHLEHLLLTESRTRSWAALLLSVSTETRQPTSSNTHL